MNAPIRRPDVRQEEDRLPWVPIALAAIAALGISTLLVVGSWILLQDRQRALRPSGDFPEARLARRTEISAVDQELLDGAGRGQRRNAQKRRELESFSWADRGAGLVNLPVDEAMRLFVEESRR